MCFKLSYAKAYSRLLSLSGQLQQMGILPAMSAMPLLSVPVPYQVCLLQEKAQSCHVANHSEM